MAINAFAPDYLRNLLLNECEKYVSLALALDVSRSMLHPMTNGKSRFETAVDETEALLTLLAADEAIAESIHLFLYTFGDVEVRCIVDGQALCDIDLPQLCQQLRSIRCNGRTPMGRCLTEVLTKLQDTKKAVAKAGISYAQPIMTIVSDGEPTDDMNEATRLIHAALAGEGQQQQLLLLPMGIGDPGTRFEALNKLLEGDRYQVMVATTAQQLKSCFRFLEQTVRIIERDSYVTVPISQFGPHPVSGDTSAWKGGAQ